MAQFIAPALCNKNGKYIEPFLGGGSVFFSVDSGAAVLADVNEDLVNAFRIVRDRRDELVRVLSCLEVQKTMFSRIRSEECRDPVARAARLLYLNRTAFNGLYRVNRRGQFNVPFGCKEGTKLFDSNILEACSNKLKRAVLLAADFRDTLALVRAGDAVFLDPPYTVKHDNNGFRRYNEHLFSWDDQLQLAEIANEKGKSDVRVVVTNAFHRDVASLYSPRVFVKYKASRRTSMASKSSSRGFCSELLLLSKAAADAYHSTNAFAGLERVSL